VCSCSATRFANQFQLLGHSLVCTCSFPNCGRLLQLFLNLLLCAAALSSSSSCSRITLVCSCSVLSCGKPFQLFLFHSGCCVRTYPVSSCAKRFQLFQLAHSCVQLSCCKLWQEVPAILTNSPLCAAVRLQAVASGSNCSD
jgi:hypothetical protein